jgi:hypothetical protein
MLCFSRSQSLVGNEYRDAQRHSLYFFVMVHFLVPNLWLGMNTVTLCVTPYIFLVPNLWLGMNTVTLSVTPYISFLWCMTLSLMHPTSFLVTTLQRCNDSVKNV